MLDAPGWINNTPPRGAQKHLELSTNDLRNITSNLFHQTTSGFSFYYVTCGVTEAFDLLSLTGQLPRASTMAVSPLISQSPTGATVSTSTTSKAKSLAVRSGSQGAPASPFKNATAASGLSDQMNDNVRRRYVKGMSRYSFTISCPSDHKV
jgi:hypothetical protein